MEGPIYRAGIRLGGKSAGRLLLKMIKNIIFMSKFNAHTRE